jgi:formylglycine-generating enzyme required for sulfatase activity
VPGNGYSNCTASIISARHIITNAHCFPQEQGGVSEAFLLMDYYSDDNEGAVRRFAVRAMPVERDAELDFAIAEVTGNPSAQFGRIMLEPRDPEPGESLLIVHHPMGKPKHMTRGGCRAHAPVAVSGTDIRHRCDTLPGSSGSPILAEGTGRMLGLHYGGALDAQVPGSFNSGKRLREIAARSRVLAAAFAEQRQEEEQLTRAAASNAAKAEVDRLRAELDAARARVAALPPAAVPVVRPDPVADVAAAEASLGLTSDQVRAIQSWLEALGHDPRGVDGRLGAGTRTALRAYQRAKGLAETGYLDADVSRRLAQEGPEAVGKRDAARGALAAAVRPPVPATPPGPAQPAVGIWPPQPARPSPGSVLRDCSDCPEMVVVPAGRFTMGAAPGEEEAENLHAPFRGRSAPRIDVSIPGPLAVGKFEVTRAEFARFVADTGHATGSACRTFENGKYEERAGRTWRAPGFAQDDRHPVVCVSWDDARAYVQWLSRKTGKGYRLLSESEWEYAARAGTTTRRPWGDTAEAGCGYANIADASARRIMAGMTWGTACDDGHAFTSPSGAYRPNAFGLHDMLGNVLEWTADCWNENHAAAPPDGSARSTGDCTRRVLRGGSWDIVPEGSRSASRNRNTADDRNDNYGFRVARTL